MGGFGLPGRLCGCGFRLGHGLHLSLGFGHLRLTLLVHELAGVRIACGLGLGSRRAGALGLLDEEVLRLELRLVGLGQLAELGIGSVGLQLAQLRRVAQARGDVVEHLVAQSLVEDGPCDLDALLHVARHKVGAGQEDLDVLARAEAVDAAVLEQTAHDGDHADVVGAAGHARD